MEIEIVNNKTFVGIHISEYEGKVRVELNINAWDIHNEDMPKQLHIFKKYSVE